MNFKYNRFQKKANAEKTLLELAFSKTQKNIMLTKNGRQEIDYKKCIWANYYGDTLIVKHEKIILITKEWKTTVVIFKNNKGRIIKGKINKKAIYKLKELLPKEIFVGISDRTIVNKKQIIEFPYRTGVGVAFVKIKETAKIIDDLDCLNVSKKNYKSVEEAFSELTTKNIV